jgi:hypothetical protein
MPCSHMKPSSTVQSLAHPSPLVVFLSSHCSLSSLIPFPPQLHLMNVRGCTLCRKFSLCMCNMSGDISRNKLFPSCGNSLQGSFIRRLLAVCTHSYQKGGSSPHRKSNMSVYPCTVDNLPCNWRIVHSAMRTSLEGKRGRTYIQKLEQVLGPAARP